MCEGLWIMDRVQVSDDYTIVVPLEAREKLHIESGDVLIAEVRGGSLLLVPENQSYVQRFRGFHREIWEGIDPREYVRQEREDCRK
jgi:AbrB family looped-hinge helix DNA binding protein